METKTIGTRAKWQTLLFPMPLIKPKYIAILGLLLTLRLILGSHLFSIPLGPTVLSFSWIVLFVTGFLYGPVIGILFGALADTLGWIINGAGLYMWEYSIQEPLICLFAGCVAVLYQVTKLKQNKWLNFMIFNFFLTAFCVVGIVMATLYSANDAASSVVLKRLKTAITKWIKLKWLIISVIICFYLLANGTYFWIWRKSLVHAHLATYVGILIIFTWVVFSWVYGPWAEVRYYQKIFNWEHHQRSELYDIYKWFLIIRVFKACLVVPLEIIVTTSLLLVLKHSILKQHDQY